MRNVREILEIIRDLNDLSPADAFGNHRPENPEYLRGQIELLQQIMGYEDDGWAEWLYITAQLGVDERFYMKEARVDAWQMRDWDEVRREQDAPADVLRERDADRWDDENACPWNCGLPHEHTEGRGADPYYYREPIDNPYRQTEGEN